MIILIVEDSPSGWRQPGGNVAYLKQIINT